MKNTLLALAALAILPLSAFSQEGAPKHVVLENTELQALHSAVTNRDYLIYIGYPDSYATHPERKYPVVYVTDGYWSFVKLQSIGSSLWYDQIVPEYIVVGIGYVGDKVDYNRERMFELSPSVATHGDDAERHVPMGGSRAFLTSIKSEIIPFIESHTRADPSFRVMAGTSMGGLFSLFSMYEEPGLFQGVISASPAVVWDDCWLFRRESELRLAALGSDYKGAYHVPTRLFMSVGDGEWKNFTGGILAFNEIIKSGDYADFTYEFQVFPGERHGGSALTAFQAGIRFVFKPMMPSPVMP
jgi:predicted alpha/beta superfamily hydrolase